MGKHLESAGFVVVDHDGSAIWGFGTDEDAAWNDFRSGMTLAGIEVVGEIDDASIDYDSPEQTPANKYQIVAATSALLAAVEKQGGNIAWSQRGCVLCLPSEE